MNSSVFFLLLMFVSACAASTFYLVRSLVKERQLVSLAGIFCTAMGLFLLVLDLILISFTQGLQYIPDYLMFNRQVSDSGFAGRWLLTSYVFVSTGFSITIYLLARNLFRKFNTKKTDTV